MYDETAYCAIAQGTVHTMNHGGRWLILALLWCGLELSSASLLVFVGALSAATLSFLEGSCVSLRKRPVSAGWRTLLSK